MIPIFAPTMLLGIALIYLFGNQGILTSLGLEIPLYGKVGIIIAESIYCFPGGDDDSDGGIFRCGQSSV